MGLIKRWKAHREQKADKRNAKDAAEIAALIVPAVADLIVPAVADLVIPAVATLVISAVVSSLTLGTCIRILTDCYEQEKVLIENAATLIKPVVYNKITNHFNVCMSQDNRTNISVRRNRCNESQTTPASSINITEYAEQLREEEKKEAAKKRASEGKR